MTAEQARTVSGTCDWRQAQSTTGGVMSGRRITLKLQVAEFPAASVAVQVTVVVPSGKTEGEGGTHTMVVAAPHPLMAMGVG